MSTRTAINHQGLEDLIAAIESSPGGAQVETQAEVQAHAAQALAFELAFRDRCDASVAARRAADDLLGAWLQGNMKQMTSMVSG